MSEPTNDDIEAGITTSGLMLVRIMYGPWVKMDRERAVRFRNRLSDIIEQMPPTGTPTPAPNGETR